MSKAGPMTGWHLKKEVTVGQIVSLVFLFLAVGGYIITDQVTQAKLESEQTNLRAYVDLSMAHLNGRMERAEMDMREIVKEIKASLLRIEDKLDEKADR